MYFLVVYFMDCIATTDRMSDEMERIWEAAAVT
jgi:hypothetical protein